MADELVRTIVATLVGRVRQAGSVMARRKPPANLAAYECVLRGHAAQALIGDKAQEAAARRFELITRPQNAYAVRLEEKVPGDAPEITWNTVESGQPVTLHHEPARSFWQKLEVHFLSLFPIDREL